MRGLKARHQILWFLPDLNVQRGRDGSGNISVGADISKGLDNNLGVVLDQQINSGIESSLGDKETALLDLKAG